MEISAFPFPVSDDFSPINNSLPFFNDFDFLDNNNTNNTLPLIVSQPTPKKQKINDPIQEILNRLLFSDHEMPKTEQNPAYPGDFALLDDDTFFPYHNSSSSFTMEMVNDNGKRSRGGSAEVISASEEASAAGSSGGAAPQGQGQSQRRLWVKDRSNAWWEQCNSPDFPEGEFKKAFRMSRATFDLICEELESVVTKKDTTLRLAIPVRQRVAVCVWRLATGEPLREVSKRFGLGISTCHKLVLEVSAAIRTVLMPKFLQWPEPQHMTNTKREFEIFSGIPNVAGAMYTTHVPIVAPKVSVAEYFNKRHTERNQKTSYSVTVQGVVDSNGVFTDVCIGWPGSMTDDKILEKSALYERANRGLLKDLWVVGNSGYPLTDWVLVPYTHQNRTWAQHGFNEKLSGVQAVAKEAFMRLKARWSCLQKRTEVKLQDLPVVLGACCVLHNICEIRGEELPPELRFDLYDDEVVPEITVRSANAMQARDQLAHKLLHQLV
ncbi:protein ANTAGONIST OF LIKE HETEROCHROMATIN PROTEIN 1-like [Ipomoea triloba]|uniref:protein ANTAGONIST OF LIKE HETEROCHROMATIN PROTEIN 1-like n=1 Tax=Ipomoea triloba TaxID=35885 RepID=UPI00125E306E|nr:protein ANTAGONIST OF LIKE HETEROCHROMATIN PROTEIN 1-like [Ipomoea triloba]